MHEVGLVEEAIRTAVNAMEAAGAASIERLTLALAPGGHVTPDAVETLFLALSVGTPAEGAVLAFEDLEVEEVCWHCGHQHHGTVPAERCAACGSAAISRLPSVELVLRYVDLPDDAANAATGRATMSPSGGVR